MQLPAVYKERDTQILQTLYDSCEANNRAFKALGVNEDSYSAIVVPTIMEKLAEQFRLTITRGQDFLEWSMEEMLDAFEKELELREAHNAVGTNSNREQERHERNSGTKKYGQHHHGPAAALLANERRGNCAI